MSRTGYTLLLILLTGFGINLWAQAVKGKADSKQAKSANAVTTKVFMPTVYLGHSDYSGGQIRKRTFDSLLKQGLFARDSMGNQYKVVNFDFGYGERKVYEDSISNLVMLTDYISVHCAGDTLPRYLTEVTDGSPGIYDRTKAGDTAYFEHIEVVKYKTDMQPMPANTSFKARAMKFYIIR